MTLPSASKTQGSSPRPWLKKIHEAKRQRTVELVRLTVDRLVQEGKTVTIEAICRLSPDLDPLNKGVKKSSILDNPVAHEYYRAHSSSYQTMHGRKRLPTRKKQELAQLPHIDPNRDEQRVRYRYLRHTKAELVERLLYMEQAYAQSQQQLVQLQFAWLEQQENGMKVNH
jgi:hypothetical protein